MSRPEDDRVLRCDGRSVHALFQPAEHGDADRAEAEQDDSDGDQRAQHRYETEQEQGFLNETQFSRIDDLTTICFGDEESFSYDLTGYLKSWYEVSHRLYPEAMVHNNQ